MVGRSVQSTMLVPRSNGRGLIISEVSVVRVFDYPIAGRLFRFAIHPPVSPIGRVIYVISEFKTGRQCGLLFMKSKRRLVPAAERHLAEVVRTQGEVELIAAHIQQHISSIFVVEAHVGTNLALNAFHSVFLQYDVDDSCCSIGRIFNRRIGDDLDVLNAAGRNLFERITGFHNGGSAVDEYREAGGTAKRYIPFQIDFH